MGTAATIDLIDHPGSTATQFEALMAHPRLQALPRLVKRQRLLRSLRAREVTEEVLQRCVEEGDGGVHHALLNRPDLPHHFLEALQRAGANKAVRNIASVRLKRDGQGAAKSVRRDRE